MAPGIASILLNAVVARPRRSKGFGCLAALNTTKDDACASSTAARWGQDPYRSTQRRLLSPPSNPQKPEESLKSDPQYGTLP